MYILKANKRYNGILYPCVLVALFALSCIVGCAAKADRQPTAVKQVALNNNEGKQNSPLDQDIGKGTTGETRSRAQATTLPNKLRHTPPYRPEISWQASYSLHDVQITKGGEKQLPPMTVGANIHTRSKGVPLAMVIRGMADLKHMNVSWASDVDQNVRVSVDVKADDDFWAALDNILRQLDYFYEVKNNTLIIKYKDTKRFYVTTPFVSGSYQTSVGGDFLGSSEATDNYHGMLQLDHNDAEIDIWQTIDHNLASILRLGIKQVAESEGSSDQDIERIRQLCSQQFPGNAARQALCVQQEQARRELQATGGNQRNNQGRDTNSDSEEADNTNIPNGIFYTIDKPLGIITVTAPRSLLEQVESYVTNLNRELSRQVVIEAKIIEVHLNNASKKGIDWAGLLRDHQFNFTTTFGDAGVIFTGGSFTKFIDSISMDDNQFNLVLNFLDDFGDVKVLSNPKISLMNGQPGIITGGKTIRYVDKVTSNVDSSGGGTIITYDVETKDIFQGVGMGVMANIADNGDIILQLSPVTTQLDGDIEYMAFGDAQVGLPKVYLRQITTMARVHDGQMLIIGGIINNQEGTQGNQVPLLGDIPYLGYLFKSEAKFTKKVEMVILLRPHIVEI